MADPISIDDPDDPRIRVYRGLRDHQLRMYRERTENDLIPMCIVEGDRLIRRAIAAGMDVVSMIRTPDRPSEIEPELADTVPIYTMEARVARTLTGMYIDRWAMACFRRPAERSFDEVTGPHTQSVLVTDRVVNPTNLGAMVRAAAGLGIHALVIDDQSCDPLYRRASRVSMGASFTLPWTRVTDLSKSLDQLHSVGFTTVAVELTEDATDLDLLDLPDRVAVVMGNEGYGVSPAVLDQVDIVTRIPMHGGVDSLNVTAAAALVCWEITRRNR